MNPSDLMSLSGPTVEIGTEVLPFEGSGIGVLGRRKVVGALRGHPRT